MFGDANRLSKTISLGLIGVGVMISTMLYIEIAVGILSTDYYYPVIPFSFISNLIVLPLLLILSMFLKPFKLLALLWLHFSMSVMLIFYSQIYSPFTAAWSILILISSIYYSWKGFIFSSIWLAMTAYTFIMMFPGEALPLLNYIFLCILVIALTVFTTYLFVTVIKGSQHKNVELLNAQRSEQLQVNRLNTLLNSINDAVLTLNRYGRITSQNASAQAFFDTNESLVGREIDTLLNLLDSDNKPVKVRVLIDNIKSSSIRDDMSINNGDETRHLSVQMSRIRGTFDDAEEYGVVLILRDITKQKSLEEEKDEFISVTSHELRTPVAIAEGSLSNFLLLQERHADESKLRETANEAHQQIVYLANMINDLSTLSRAERGIGDVIEAIDLNALLNDIFNRYTPQAEAKSLKLNLDIVGTLPEIETSRLYLEEILQNFVTNSIKYTKTGSVTIGGKIEGADKVKFFVSDTGIGISKTDMQHVFQKFWRSEDYRTRETSGTGLGLYVVAKLAQKLNIKIDVESRLNFGSTFSFILPIHTKHFGGASKNATEPSVQQVENMTPQTEEVISAKA